MKCIIVTPYYPPDRGHAPRMYSALAEDLASSGTEVTVVTGQPNYSKEGSTQRKIWPLVRTRMEGGVRVFRVFVPMAGRNNIPARIVNVGTFNIIAALVIMFRVSVDAAIVVNPAMYTFFPVLAIRLKGGRLHYRVHDLYPDIGVRLGVIRNRLISRVLWLMELFCFRTSREISVVSRGFVPILEARGVEAGKIVVIRDWEDIERIHSRGKTNSFSTQHGYDSKFVIFYGGNLGRSQGLNFLLETADRLRGHPDIMFVIVGEGADQSDLIAKVREIELQNVQFHPFQSADSLDDVYATADVGVVSLLPGISPEWCPAKIYSNMAAKLPLIAIVDLAGEAARTIEEAECGILVVFGDHQGLVDAILKLRMNPRICSLYGANGRDFVMNHASRSVCVAEIRKSLTRITA